MSCREKPILVVACGNVMAGDDAFGPRVAHLLREVAPPDVEVVDVGMKPAGLLNHLENRQALILVDAAQPTSELPAGTLVDVDFLATGRPPLLHDAQLSSHGLSISHELQLARRLQLMPRQVYLVAVTVRAAAMGRPMDSNVERQVEPAVQCVLRRARQCRDRERELTNA